jgi:hypothetical protein
LRQPIVRAELDNILNDFIPLTKKYSTANSVHMLLEQIVEVQFLLAISTDYGLPLIYKSLLKVANTTDTHFLLQAELKALKKFLYYEEIHYHNGSKYQGYINEDGQREGPGILISIIGEI